MYRCYIDDCEFYMDVKCASFVEALNHTAHQHPLFLEQRFDIGSSNPYKCMACGLSAYRRRCSQWDSNFVIMVSDVRRERNKENKSINLHVQRLLHHCTC
ncbi:hypothetical protein Bca4012_087374 [Brassica carinata]|uniref:(rape) hypothetical protein n=1 Tax=Brassica napus TaxID=3708 RepID=A0A816R691_BRANA|nr:unnamed protein product [Brassica napus]